MKRLNLWPVAVLVSVIVGAAAWMGALDDGLHFARPALAQANGNANGNGNSNSNSNGNANGNANGNGNSNGNSNGNDNSNSNSNGNGNDGDGPPVINITTAVGAACDVPGLRFESQVCNVGTTDLQEVVLTDTLPVGMVFSDGSIIGVDAYGNDIGAGPCTAGTVPAADACPCEGGVTFLRMRYDGPDATSVTVEAKNALIYSAVLNGGDVFELNGSRPDGRFQKNNLVFTVNGQDTVIHVSCSQPIGVGFVFGPFTVEALASRNAGLFDVPCVPPPPACPCQGGVTSLTLRFNGNIGTPVTVEDNHTVVFDQILNDADVFVLNGTRADGRFQKNNLILSANGQDTTIHVSCSQPIGIGSVFGPFTVEAFSSRDGGAFSAPCDGTGAGTPPSEDHGGDHGDPCKGQKVKICLPAPIPPGECVSISYVATFANVLCSRVEVKARTGDTAAPGQTVKTKTSLDTCLDGLLTQFTDCVCAAPPSPIGACCFTVGICVEATQVDCAAAGGLYQGDGVVCVPGLCPAPVGDPFDITAFCDLNLIACDFVAAQDCVFAFQDDIAIKTDAAIQQFLLDYCDTCCTALAPCSVFSAETCFLGG